MNLATLALRNLRRRATRSVIVTISVGLAVASALSLVALADSIEFSASVGADERGSDLVVLSRNATDVFESSIGEDRKSALTAIKDVATAEGEMMMFAPVDNKRHRLVMGSAVDSLFWKKMPLAAGRLPKAGEARAVVLGKDAVSALEKQIGDTVTILDEPFKIVGIADYKSALNRSLVYTRLSDLQTIAFRPKRVTMFHLDLKPLTPPQRVEEIKAEVARLGGLIASPTDQFLQRDRNLAVMKAVAKAVSGIALTLGALSVLNTLLMAVQERTREIGIMIAIGWSRSRTMGAIVLEGVFIGIAGCCVGIPASFLISYFFHYLPTVGDLLSFQPSAALIIPVLLCSVALCGLGALYPAWSAASMRPADALRRL